MKELIEQAVSLLQSIPPIGAGALILFAIAVPLWIVKRAVLFQLRRLIGSTRFTLDSIFLDAIQRPLSVFIFVLALMATEAIMRKIEILPESLDSSTTLLSKVLFIFGIILFVDKFVRLIITRYQASSPMLRTSGNLLKGTVRGLIIVIGCLIILSSVGISITPIIASLGIGSLAVALALQPTLENFFSGIQILADKPIRVGDYIELDSGEQGFVEKIGWRSTWIKMLPNNIVIIPNSLLAKSKVINYYYPEKQLSVPVEVGVHYDSDLEHVEKVTLDVAKQILKSHKWGIDDYETFVVFHTFDNSSINFTVMLRAEEYFNRFFIKSEFIKALHKRFKQEGIVIPYPISALNLNQEGAEKMFKEIGMQRGQ